MTLPICISLLYAKRPNVDQLVNFVKIVGIVGIAGLFIQGIYQVLSNLFS